MSAKRRLSERGVKKMREREAAAGLDTNDEAARWLAEHDATPEPLPPKSAGKNKELHRWRRSR